MTIANKLTYLNGTKLLLRDAIRRAGHYLADNAKFRDYPYALLTDESSLTLDFEREEYIAKNWRDGTVSRIGFANIINFTRASGGGRFNHLGVYEWVAANTPRIDYDPATLNTSSTGVEIGAGLKTFTVTRLYTVGDYVRATADASNWISGRVTAATSSSVTLWVDKVVGSGTYASWTLIKKRGLLIEEARTNVLLNSDVLATQTRSVTATAHTLAFYGTGSVTLSGAATGTLTGTGANNRVALTFTPSAVNLTLTVSGSVTSADLQAGSFITSHIPTTSAQVTRAADVAAVADLSDWYREGALVARWSLIFTQAGATGQHVAVVSDGGFNNYVGIRKQADASIRGLVNVGGVIQANMTAGVATSSVMRAAMRIKADDFAISLDGASPVRDASGTLPLVNKLDIGLLPDAGQFLNGHIESISYFPRALSDTELQRITSL